MKSPFGFASVVLVTVWISFIACQTVTAFQDAEFSVAGIAIAKEDPDSEYGGSMAPGLQPGTTIYLQVKLPGQTVIKIKRIEDKPIEIRDSTGKELPDSGSDFGFMADISDDGKTIQLPISSGDIPAKGSNSINVKGSVMLDCGKDSKTEEVEVKIANGEKFKFAGIDFEVTQVEDSFMDDDAQMFEFQSNTSPSRIQEIKAVMANGKTVDLDPSGSSEFGFGKNVTYGRSYNVPGKAADVKSLNVTFFQEVKEVELPFEFKVELGL